MKTGRLAVCTCALLGVVTAGPASAATTRHVWETGSDSGDCVATPCLTIAYAVGQAAPGDTIAVADGTYAEAVAVTKRLLPIGHNAIIDATGHDNGVVISGPDSAGSVLLGFTIANADLEGVLVLQTSHIRIERNVIVQNDALWDPDNIPLPCQSSDDCGEGLHLLSVTRSLVAGNLVANNVGGILLTDELGPTAGNTISGNLVRDNEKDCGITLASHYFSMVAPATPDAGGVYGNLVTFNTSERNGAAGIGIFTGPPGAAAYRNLVIGNLARDNGLPGVALHSHAPFQYLNDNAIIGNTLSGNGPDDDAETEQPAGIVVWSAVIPVPRTVISGNRIANEYYGVFTEKAMNVLGLPSNKIAASVAIPFSIH